jgi:hypothetical protein
MSGDSGRAAALDDFAMGADCPKPTLLVAAATPAAVADLRKLLRSMRALLFGFFTSWMQAG